MRLKKFISAEERKKLEAAVREAEAKSSGEIVPAVVERSSTYAWVGYRAALLGWAVASLVALWAHYYRPFLFEFWETQAMQAGGLLLGWLFSRSRFALKILVSGELMAEEVKEAAQAAFLKHGLANTRDRTGVLLFVSLKEHRVQILADSGIHEKVGEEFWRQESDRIAGSIRQGSPAEGMIAAIHSIGEKLQQHFPRKADDRNELPNRLRTD
ncbi:MAG TPA: TPM domain-containing protein [Bdellovibrionota bacterium]|jgi:putative membrane protein